MGNMEKYLIEETNKLIAQVKQEDLGSDVFYWVRAICGNCGFQGLLAFRKGRAVSSHACPKCENKTLN